MSNTSAAAPGIGKSILITLGILVIVAILLGIYKLLGIEPFFAGFFFALYWTGLKGGDFREFLPSVVGGLGGLGLAAALHHLPQLHGAAGLSAALGAIVLAIFLQVRGTLPVLINMAFMLFLTVGTIPAVSNMEDYPGMALALVVTAAFAGGLLWLAGRIGAGGGKPRPEPELG